jgi:hypothetical protein
MSLENIGTQAKKKGFWAPKSGALLAYDDHLRAESRVAEASSKAQYHEESLTGHENLTVSDGHRTRRTR